MDDLSSAKAKHLLPFKGTISIRFSFGALAPGPEVPFLVRGILFVPTQTFPAMGNTHLIDIQCRVNDRDWIIRDMTSQLLCPPGWQITCVAPYFFKRPWILPALADVMFSSATLIAGAPVAGDVYLIGEYIPSGAKKDAYKEFFTILRAFYIPANSRMGIVLSDRYTSLVYNLYAYEIPPALGGNNESVSYGAGSYRLSVNDHELFDGLIQPNTPVLPYLPPTPLVALPSKEDKRSWLGIDMQPWVVSRGQSIYFSNQNPAAGNQIVLLAEYVDEPWMTSKELESACAKRSKR